MIYIIDRIEGNIAVLEEDCTQKMLKVQLGVLPTGVKEGDCLLLNDGQFFPCPEKTGRLRKAVEKLMDGLWK